MGTDVLRWLLRAEYVALAVAAWRVALSGAPPRSYHRPFALYATAVAVADLLHAALVVTLRGHVAPFAGAWRVIFHAEQLAYLAGYVALPALALVVCVPRWAERWPHVLGVGGLAWAALVAGYPRWTSMDRLTACYGVIHAACFAASVASLWAKTVRLRGVWVSETERLVAVMVAADTAVLLGPALAGRWTEATWDVPRVAAIVVEAWAIWSHVVWLRATPGQLGR